MLLRERRPSVPPRARCSQGLNVPSRSHLSYTAARGEIPSGRAVRVWPSESQRKRRSRLRWFLMLLFLCRQLERFGRASFGEQGGGAGLTERAGMPAGVFRGKDGEFTLVPSRAACSEARAG